ncbi:MAG: serine hydrolase [Candidatus Omnitrophota bacterium]
MKIRILIVCIICLAASLFSIKIYKDNLVIAKHKFFLNKKKEAWLKLEKSLETKLNNFKGQVGLVVEDLDTGWVIAFNENMLVPSASLVKVPIMLSYFYAAEEGKIKLDDNIKFRSFEKLPDKLSAKSGFIVEELFSPMITLSDNSATNALIDFLGFDALNEYFEKMGLKNTNLSRKMLDFKSRSKGIENYTTAYDMAYILDKLYRRQFLSQDVSEKCLVLLNQQKINDRIPKKLPKEDVSVAHKTGLERHICHDAGIVYTQKGNFLICVLVKHGNKFSKTAKKFIADTALSVYDCYKNL